MSEPPTKYLMNDIPRGTSASHLIATVFGPPAEVHHDLTIEISQLDDEDSVTTLEFITMPDWLQRLGPGYFHYKTSLGTVWGGVDTARDSSGKTAFMRAVIAGDILRAEMLAEFAATDLNEVDEAGWTALHWACSEGLEEMTEFCLSLPGLDSGVICQQGSTAFDIAYTKPRESENDDGLSVLFYKSTLAMEKHDPQGALLRLITLTEPGDERREFPGEFLFDPAASGNEPLVKALLKRGIGLTATNQKNETALHLAAQNGHPGVTRTLLEMPSRGKTIDVHAVADGQMTALHYAAKNASPETVRVLVRGGAKLEAVSVGGKTALHYAAQQASPETVRELVDLGADKEAACDDGKTPLDLAAENGNEDMPQIMRIILNPQVDVDDVNAEGETSLYVAASKGQLEVVKLLLEIGASVDRAADRVETALHIAAKNGHAGVVELLLDRGFDIDACDQGGKTPLHLAAAAGHPEVVGLLRDRTSNIEANDQDGKTPLHLAVAAGRLEVVGLLLDEWPEANACDQGGKTLLHLAAEAGHPEVVGLLLDRGSDIDACDQGGKTPLHLAVAAGHLKVVRLLLDRKSNIEAYDQDGKTPLHLAAAVAKQLDLVRLMQHLKDSAIAYNVVEKHVNVLRLLLQRGASRDSKDRNGNTPFEVAEDRRRKTCLTRTDRMDRRIC